MSDNSSKENGSLEKLKPDIEFSLEKSNEIINIVKTIDENFKFKPCMNSNREHGSNLLKADPSTLDKSI